MSAVLDRDTEITTADPFDSLSLDLLTTPDDAPVPARATREAAPVSDLEDAEAGSDTPQRDASGRFAGREGSHAAEGADDTAPQPEAAPEPDTKPEPSEAETLKAQLERMARELETQRGQVDNAAKQAAEKARREERAAAETRTRESIRTELQRQIDAGEISFEQGKAIFDRKQGEWAQEDRQQQETEHHTRSAGLLLSEVETESRQMGIKLAQRGFAVLAEDTGLAVEHVADFWRDTDEQLRFERAAMQAQMARKLPGAGFNAAALDDYMATAVANLTREAAVRKELGGTIAELRKENARLQQELNREEADSPAHRPERPTRGGGARRALSPDEHATSVLSDHANQLAQALGLHR